MKKLTIILLALISLAGEITAQGIQDIVYANSPVLMGTPRFTATAGAFTALGNDFSGVQLNPAGLGVFRHDEFSIAMGVGSRTVSSSYYGLNQSQDWSSFLFTNVGYTKKILTDDPNVTWNFGITYNRNFDFSYESETYGINPESSILEDWMFFADGTNPDDLLASGLVFERLAWESYLIEADANDNYFTEAELDVTEQFWAERVTGRFDELGLSFATERNNKLYLGGSLNLPFYRYDSDFYYTEAGYGGDSISGMEWRENFSNRGVGVNLKVGAIYKVTNNVRVGASIFTPSFIWVTQTYSTEVQGNFRNSGAFLSVLENEPFRYTIRNAPVGNLGLSYVFNKNGFISIDYSYIPTRWSGTPTNDIDYLNQDIDAFLKNQHLIKVGAEVRLVSIYLRAGYNWLSNPYDIEAQDASRSGFNLGIGYRSNKFNVDMSYSIQNQDQTYYPYSPEIVQGAAQQVTRRPFIISASFRL